MCKGYKSNSNIKAALDQATSHHQKGEFRPAELIYKNILEFQPRNAEVLHLLGLLTWQTNQCEVAIDLIRQATQIKPGNPLFLRDLARFLHSSDYLNQAIQIYQQALEIVPEDSAIGRELVSVLHQTGKHDGVLQVLQHIVDNNPSDTVSHVELGNFLQSTGRFEEAVRVYRKAISIDPNTYEAYSNLSVALCETARFDQAIQVCQNAIHIFPNYYEVYVNIGNIYKEVKQFNQAVESYQKAIRINPEVAEVHFSLGNVLKELDRHEEAIQTYQRVFLLNPDYAEAYYNHGVVLQDRGKFNQAVESYQKAIRINPDYARAYNNYGFILHKQGKFLEAMHQYRRAIDLDPTIAQAHTNLGIALLLNGDFQKGWRKYEWRLKTESYQPYARNFPQPMWHGCDLKDKTILVWAEQGIGDQIMFANVFHLLVQKSQRIVVEIEPRLVSVFQRSFPDITFFPQLNPPDSRVLDHSIDYQIPIASLAQHFLITESSFPKCKSYLVPCSEKKQQFRHKYRKIADGRLLVGISWKGGNREKESRTIPLGQWADLLSADNCCFVNLQYGNVTEEIREFSAATGVSIHCDNQVDSSKDLDVFFAQVAAMDLIVSIANSTAHIAGSLGKSALICLPYVPDWRWMVDRTDSLWYSEIILLRQERVGDWSSVLREVAAALDQFIPTRGNY